MVEIEEKLMNNCQRYLECNEKTVSNHLKYRKTQYTSKINVKASKSMQALKKETTQ